MNVFFIRNLTETELLLFNNSINETGQGIFGTDRFEKHTGFNWKSGQSLLREFGNELRRRDLKDTIPSDPPKIFENHFRAMIELDDLRLMSACIKITITELDNESAFSARIGIERHEAIEIYECLAAELELRG